jgi:hypothetical protein
VGDERNCQISGKALLSAVSLFTYVISFIRLSVALHRLHANWAPFPPARTPESSFRDPLAKPDDSSLFRIVLSKDAIPFSASRSQLILPPLIVEINENAKKSLSPD